MTLERGTTLNKRYRIVEILGQGGMASIYRAIDENLGVDVAVKENLFTTEEYARQFRLEAVILANLRHQNLPRVTDHFVIDGQGQYLVMDFIEGEDLRQRMDRLGPLPEDEVIVLGVAICEALSYLHSRTPPVLHRDIKPGNVKITPNGQIYLVDFGLAKVAQRGQATTTGARAMTPGYSPPEQYGTARTDPRTDVYSLGATLYSALTDALPEDGLARAMDQAVLTPVRQRNQKVSKRLAAVVEKALEVRPDNRYQIADEMKQALLSARSTTQRRAPLDLSLSPPPALMPDGSGEPFQPQVRKSSSDPDSLPLSLPPSTPLFEIHNLPGSGQRRSPWSLWLALALVVLLFTGGTASYIFRSDLPFWGLAGISPSPTLTSTIPAAEVQAPTIATLNPTATTTPPSPTQTATVRPTRAATITRTLTATPSPMPTPLGGGSGQLAFASDRSGVPNIWLMNIDGTGLKQLTDIPEGACQPDWSPDGQKLVFISPCKGSEEIYSGSNLYLVNADGSDMRPLTSEPGGDYDPSWSPDGKFIVFTSLRKDTLPQIYIRDMNTGETSMIADPDGKVNANPAWSPDGERLVFVGSRGQVWAMNLLGQDRILLSRVLGNYRSRNPVWSPDGTLVIFTQYEEGQSGSPWLAKVGMTEGSISQPISREYPMADPSFSPDGIWLVYRSWPDGNRHNLYIIQPSGVGRTQITNDIAKDFDPDWRP